jgi:hypothetical protein
LSKRATSFTLRAGPAARAIIAREGFSPDAVGCIAAAAGGPKWLILGALDRVLFGEWLRERKTPLPAVGSSIGAYRLVCGAQADPCAAIDRFEQAYLAQRYGAKPTGAEVTAEARRIIAAILSAGAVVDVLGGARLSLNLTVTHVRGLAAATGATLQRTGFGLAFLANLARPRWLAAHFDRYVFHSGERPSARLADDEFKTVWVPLTADNLHDAVLASGTLPLIMDRIGAIAGAPPGHYIDGGMIDYQMDLALTDARGILFLPHYEDRIVPRWFDKPLRWRRARRTDRTLLLCPSRELIARLPAGRIPSREDFAFYRGRDAERLRAWNAALDAGRRMADEFREAMATGSLEAMVEPL